MKKKHQKGKINKKYELFDALCQEMEEKDYRMQDKTFSAKEAGTQGMLLPIPFIVLVVIGYFLLSLLFPNTELILLSAFNIFMAAGDLLIFWGARSIHEGLVIDHPELPGFVVFTK